MATTPELLLPSSVRNGAMGMIIPPPPPPSMLPPKESAAGPPATAVEAIVPLRKSVKARVAADAVAEETTALFPTPREDDATANCTTLSMAVPDAEQSAMVAASFFFVNLFWP